MQAPFESTLVRVGEASHPGPPGLFSVGSSNPGGLRGKEDLLLDWGPGIWALSETQLSAVTQVTCSKAFRFKAKAVQRNLRLHHGAPAPLRASSSWAGSWTGVAQVSDFPSVSLTVPWTEGAYGTGRVQIAQHMVGHLPVTVCNVYGYSPSPLFPDARARTDRLLRDFSREVVLGRKGVRIICGDLNHAFSSLSEIDLWTREGWIECQDAAWQRWQQPPLPTCKHSTRRDAVFLSPEAASLLESVQVFHCFADHATVVANLRVDLESHTGFRWPAPCLIPWESVSLGAWHDSWVAPSPHDPEPQAWWSQFAHNFESSLNGYMSSIPGGQLPSNCFGRSQRTAPLPKCDPCVPLRASRPGEERMHSDFLGVEVQRWYKQVRRLQSLVHAARAASVAPGAQVYRSELWGAIVRARGCAGGFRGWWRTRPIQLQGSRQHVPDGLPDLRILERIFDDFRQNFRRFENWHMRRRGEILQSKYQQSKNELFRALRKDSPSQVDTLTVQGTYQILGTDSNSGQLHLDSEVDQRGHSSWTLDGIPVCVVSAHGDVVQLESDLHDQAFELEQNQLLSSVADVQDEFVRLWQPRWQKHQDVPPEAWHRICTFIEAYLPSFDLRFEPLTCRQWRAAVRRFKEYAARGPDSWAKADLVNMPDGAVRLLLQKLHDIEQGRSAWPPQILIGFVCSLLKPGGRTDASAYRPIVLLSLIYRVWSGIRSRQILRQLAPLLPQDCLGFVPGRETTEYWYHIQTQIELCCQGAFDLYGMSCDVVKAFNNLPRFPIARMASHIGLPEHITRPWFAFADGLRRHFLVRDCLSRGISSSSGFAEGCPLSPVAMVLTDLALSLYQRAFAPAVQSITYVDNWSCLAHQVGDLATGINVTRTFCDLLALELDPQKTYVWSANRFGRKDLRGLGLPILDSTRELGGIISFGSRGRNAMLVARCRSLDPLWALLRRLPAPLQFKTAMLSTKFWASALHGAAGVLVGESVLSSLRTAAARALKANSGGGSAMLRLSLSGSFEADPGFYQTWLCVRDLRRMLRKAPGLLVRWRIFQSRFSGQLFPGPFSKLLQVFGLLGWQLEDPPFFVDRSGLRHCIRTSAPQLLYQLVARDWLSHVADLHRHRKTMTDLHGIEPSLALLDHQKLSALDMTRVHALQSGAFHTPASQAKFDNSQSGRCSLCHVADNVQHRVCQCPRFLDARQGSEWVVDTWSEMPTCLSHHLLPPAVPEVALVRTQLHGLADDTASFACVPGTPEVHHLFTDGACTQHICPDLCLAAWGVVCANSGLPVSSGFVPGLLQTAPRAELTAIISALRWTIRFQQRVIIWSDAKWLVDSLQCRLIEGFDVSDGDNCDLWDTVAMLCDQLTHEQFWIKHVPSHLDAARCCSPFEEWVAANNNHVDLLASVANACRPHSFMQTHQLACQAVELTAARIRGLRKIFMGIADCTAQSGARHAEPQGDEPDDQHDVTPPVPVDADPLQELLPLDWAHRVGLAQTLKLSAAFVTRTLTVLLEWSGRCSSVFTISWLELAFMFSRDSSFEFPVFDAGTNCWRSAQDVPFADTRVSVSNGICLIKTAICTAMAALDLALPRSPPIDLSAIRVFPRQGGILVCCSESQVIAAREAIFQFCSTQPIRTASDLSRPL